VSYSWSVDGRRIEPQRIGCTFSSYAFPTLGRHVVDVQANVGGERIEGHEEITLEDLLIVSIGDSVASGEGVPEIPIRPPRRLRAAWQNKRCHRSANAAPAVAAQRLAERYPRISVTFVHLACSGASIDAGLIGEYRGISGARFHHRLPAQVDELNALAARREPAAVLVSIGANDVGFSKIVTWCGALPHGQSCFRGALGRKVTSGLRTLPQKYEELDKRIEVPATRIYLTEYFDPTGDVFGAPCERILKPRIPGLGSFGLNQEDLEDARNKLLVPLNDIVSQAATHYHWTEITGIEQAFRGHGYCAEGPQGWITTLKASSRQQGGFVGTLHPNLEGHRQIAARIDAALIRSAALSCVAAQRGTVQPVAYSPALSPPPVALSCLSPLPVDLPISSAAAPGGLSAPVWTLIGLGAAAILLLLAIVGGGPTKVRKAAPMLFLAVIGAALIVLGVELQDHAAPAVVLMAAGAAALIASPALLWWQAPRVPRARVPSLRLQPETRNARLGALMGAKGWSTSNIVVVGLGAALAVFFAGVTAAVAAGQTPPTAMWAAGSAVAGALIGLLVPAPGSKKAHVEASEAAEAVAHKATAEASDAMALSATAQPADAPAHKADAEAAEAAAHNATDEAIAHKVTAAGIPETTIATGLLFAFFLLSLGLGIALAAGAIVPPQPFIESLKGVTTAVIALASASGSALIGILAPSPGKAA